MNLEPSLSVFPKIPISTPTCNQNLYLFLPFLGISCCLSLPPSSSLFLSLSLYL